MKLLRFCCCYLLAIHGSFAVDDITAHETNSVRITVFRPPEPREYFTINDIILISITNRAFPTNVIFVPSQLETFVEISCTSVEGKNVSKKRQNRAIGKRFNDVPAQVVIAPIRRGLWIEDRRGTVFRAPFGNFLANRMYDPRIVKQLFTPSEIFEFPPGEYFLMKLRFQLILQRGNDSKYHVIKFPEYQIHLRRK